MNTTHKATLLAWVSTDNAHGMAAVGGDDAVAVLQAAAFYLTPDDTPERRQYWESSHVCIGRADITLILDAPAKITDAQITTLRAKKASVLAEAQNEATQIEWQIQTLLAITNEVQV